MSRLVPSPLLLLPLEPFCTRLLLLVAADVDGDIVDVDVDV